MIAKTPVSLPEIPDLPIFRKADEIKAAIQTAPVVIIAGETGSGKSTQIPKLCLELGRGQVGLIGCTQPRRIAARSVARRVAEELGESVGQRVGFQVRFNTEVSEATQIKFMTDGILLSEIHHDRELRCYDTLIIDEAHERSLNIDFLLGYLKSLLNRRSDLKIIITSATINTEQFSRHFSDAPVIEVEGRGYPVEIQYLPPTDSEALGGQIKKAIDRLTQIDPLGDVLVFLPGEREIFQVAKWLRRAEIKHTDVLPLYARLPAEAQDKIFKTGAGRRIVLATNVAETSLTVPGIRFVIDTGLARISRYTAHSRVLRLPIEPVSQAACQQRAGRCGRIGPGVCIRLFEEADFIARPSFTEPEIVRSSLVGVILQMRALELGDPEDFPFIDRPPNKLLGEAWQTLTELGAIDASRQLTEIGRILSRLPMDARFGRMLIEASRRGVVDPVLVLIASLSVGDVRDRPLDQQQAADQAHRSFVAPGSDFLTQLNVWNWWQKTRKDHSTSQANKLAKAQFLAPNRLHEWSQLYRQLKEIATDEGWSGGQLPLDWPVEVHRSVLAGLLAMIGRLDDEGIYEGVRGHRFRIFPGSVLSKSRPVWIMSAERVDTGQTFARMVTSIDPQWLESQASHLLKRRVFDPYWSRKTGRVMGFEQLSLHGLVVVAKKRVHYGPHDPSVAREIFIRHGLARGEIEFGADFIKHNQELRNLLAQHEHKQRRRDVLTSEESLMRFFDAKLPSNIYSTKQFVQWYQSLDAAGKQGLLMDQATLLREHASLAQEADFPDHWSLGLERYRLHYRFEPGHEADGVTLDCPLHLINQLDQDQLAWLVPGMTEEKIAALIASLRKSQRRLLVPIKDYAKAAWQALDNSTGSLPERLAQVLSKLSGLNITSQDFALERIPLHLIMRIRVLDEDGSTLDTGRNLTQLKRKWGGKAREQFMAKQASQWHQDGLSEHELIDLPHQIETAGGHRAWPAWVSQGQKVGIRLFDTEDAAAVAHLEGLVVLGRVALVDKLKYVKKNIRLSMAAQVAWTTQESVDELTNALLDQILGSLIEDHGGISIRSQGALRDCWQDIRGMLVERCQQAIEVLDRVLVSWHGCLSHANHLYFAAPKNIDDVISQLSDLIYPGFISDINIRRLNDYGRYLKGVEIRLKNVELDPKRDWDRVQQVAPFWHRYLDHLEQGHWYTEALDRYRWAVEDYRIQLFAQSLGTAQKVSPKRLEQLWSEAMQSVKDLGEFSESQTV